MSSALQTIAFVCPRYESTLSGGAEYLVRAYAAELTRRGICTVHVLTTCAQDHFTWENVYAEGSAEENGVTIKRFAVDDRDVGTFLRVQALIDKEEPLYRTEEINWISNSVRSKGLTDYLKAESPQYKAVIFIPYLFGTTYFGIHELRHTDPAKVILWPCLHDEPFAYLKIMHEIFSISPTIIFNAGEELELAGRLYGTIRNGHVLGLGIERDAVPAGAVDAFKKKYGITAPYLLYVGRKEGGKNAAMIADYFSVYRRHRKTDTVLVLAGSGTLEAEDTDGVIDVGFLSEDEKMAAYAGCLSLCQPSLKESFSIVMMECWLSGRPCLVHSECPVTRGHCDRCGGGLYFKDYYEFEACLDWMRGHPEALDAMGKQGKTYVEKNYAWDTVTATFQKVVCGET